jgi:ubiquinone/menaquinone biosynthesis C-methylase UbiE
MNRFEYKLMNLNLGRNVFLRNIVKRLLMLSQLPPGKKVLEIGCGNGVGSKHILEFFRPEEFIATDLDERLVEIARNKNIGEKTKFEVGDATDLRFQNNEFDAVLGLSVIHHIPNWKDCIDELQRITKPDGFLILKELSIESFETPFGKLSRKIVSHPYESMFIEKEFIEHIKNNGFEVCEHRPHSVLFFLNDFFLIAKKVKR